MSRVEPDDSIETPGPTMGELRVAGIDGHLARLRADVDAVLAPFEATRRGRLALRLSRWYARRQR
jgi:hypothetical protein